MFLSLESPLTGNIDRILMNLSVGERVVIPSTKQRGTLKFLGRIAGKEGVWAGLELDSALGKNDGSVNG